MTCQSCKYGIKHKAQGRNKELVIKCIFMPLPVMKLKNDICGQYKIREDYKENKIPDDYMNYL